MAKKEKKTKAVETIGSLNELIGLLSKENKSREFLVKSITKDGPPHKQWQHTLVLNQIQKLLLLKNKGSKVKLVPSAKNNIVVEHHDQQIEVPIGFPELLNSIKHSKLEKELSKGPEHEVVYTAIILQSLEWLISMENTKKPSVKTIKPHVKTNSK